MCQESNSPRRRQRGERGISHASTLKPRRGHAGGAWWGILGNREDPWGTSSVEWHQKSLAKVGRDQGRVQGGIGRSGACRAGANPILNIRHPHHSPLLGATNNPILLEVKSQTLEDHLHCTHAPGWMW